MNIVRCPIRLHAGMFNVVGGDDMSLIKRLHNKIFALNATNRIHIDLSRIRVRLMILHLQKQNLLFHGPIFNIYIPKKLNQYQHLKDTVRINRVLPFNQYFNI
jgi:hypothetical protein